MDRATSTAQVEAVAETLRGLVAELDPGSVPLVEAPELWRAFDGIERLAAAATTLLAARVDESGAWREAGSPDAASYLAASAGGSISGARRRLATSRRLEKRLDSAAALRAGAISTTQADQITDAAAVNPGAERRLLELARSRVSLKELGDACGRAKAAGDPDPDATYSRIHAERRLQQRRDAEGAWCLYGRGTADAGGLVNRAIDEIADELFVRARDVGETPTRDQLAFDALHEMARRVLGTDWHDDEAPSSAATTVSDYESGGAGDGKDDVEADPAPVRSRRRRRRRSREMRYLGLLRVDVTALRRGHAEGDELVEIAGVGPIPVSRARELLGDAVVKLVITDGVDVLSVTHLGRSPTVAQRVALLWQTPSCSVAGCPSTWVEWDHRVDWAVTRHTRLDELDGLCRHHHLLKTALGWALVEGKGKRPLVPPDDPRHPRHHTDSTSGPPERGSSVSAGPLFDNSAQAA